MHKNHGMFLKPHVHRYIIEFVAYHADAVIQSAKKYLITLF